MTNEEIRNWALSEGYYVCERGGVSKAVRAAFDVARKPLARAAAVHVLSVCFHASEPGLALRADLEAAG